MSAARVPYLDDRRDARSSALIREPCLLLAAVRWLAFGILIYALARPPTEMFPFISQHRFMLTSLRRLICFLGPLPTFVHVMAFSLLSAAIVGVEFRRVAVVSGGWMSVEVVFELAQYPVARDWLLQHQSWIEWIPYARSFLMWGTFDWADVTAAFLGAGLSVWTLRTYRRGMTY